ncbi:hypothetical protein [Sphingobium sp. SCG-1]|uniref:hypothetical protein n=1 Tax=Sphingobium sp. SCG-1 TaxID=2072936 RepID=UPI001670AB76|nr:hypothetical protein [Sphingobium sp. SCG-1]
MQRSADQDAGQDGGEPINRMTGEEAYGSLLDLYDVAGGIRNTLTSLQAAVAAAEHDTTPKKGK